MDSIYWDKLELPAVLNRLEHYASFSAGKVLALALTPSADLAEVGYRQAETTEARRLLDVSDLSLGGAHDLRPLAENALRGLRLMPQDLLDVRDTLRRAAAVQRSLAKQQERYPILSGLARSMAPCPALSDEIDRCIGEHGDVLDSASPALGRIRAELKVAYDRLMDRLNSLLSNPTNTPHLQEGYITQRDGRYVIPLKAQSRGRIPGVVHDQSSSGVTLFIEPLATVDLNNTLRELQIEEQREVDRILLALSGMVAGHAEEIVRTVEAMAQLDLALAKARYAEDTRAHAPEMVPWGGTARRRDSAVPFAHPGSALDLPQARHPLIDPQVVVPIDVRLSPDYFVIVITGPNTGGKTVSLKTIGLLALMAQCGLHLPTADGARLSVFEHICADIGDEQSIEQSLSTFSSHLTRIIQILRDADDHSLILLDELGAGTDPVEGAALARALLTHLLQRRATTVVTTHHPELKIFAHSTPGVTNASVEFDIETLSPTYRLTIGLPGHSNALAIATRLGLSEAIIRRARSLLSENDQQLERFLVEIKDIRTQTAEVRARVEAEHAQAERLRADLDGRLRQIDREREAILNQARAQMTDEVEAVRRELRTVRQRMAVGGAARNEARVEMAQMDAQLEALVEQSARPAPSPPLRTPIAGQIEEGDTVWVANLDAEGQVLLLDGDAAEVQVGAFRVRTRQNALELRHKKTPLVVDETTREALLSPTPNVSIEIHLRGLRVEAALEQLGKYLDNAYLAQMPFVRIVHGKGTGMLKKAVREFLLGHRLVRSFQDAAEGEGDTGVTIVRFKEG